MKRTLQLITITLFILLNSCDKSDSEADLIIGKWEIISQHKNDTETIIGGCKPTTVEFLSNGKSIQLEYIINISGDCVVLPSINSNWEKVDSNKYKITYNNSNFSQWRTAIFENNNNRLILQDGHIDENGEYALYKTIYKRI